MVNKSNLAPARKILSELPVEPPSEAATQELGKIIADCVACELVDLGVAAFCGNPTQMAFSEFTERWLDLDSLASEIKITASQMLNRMMSDLRAEGCKAATPSALFQQFV